MFALLSPKLWAALIVAGMIAAAGFTGYRSGKASVRAAWDRDKLKQSTEALRMVVQRDRQQDDLRIRAGKVDDALQKQKALRVESERTIGKLRDDLGAALDRAASQDTPTTGGTDAADPRPAIASECIGRLVAMDSAYAKLADKTRALQSYASSVCVTP